MIRAAIALVLLVASCSDSFYRDRVVRTAAAEHRCQQPRIKSVVAEDRMGGDFSYWVDVCGRERLYRMDTTTGGRFVDQTLAVK